MPTWTCALTINLLSKYSFDKIPFLPYSTCSKHNYYKQTLKNLLVDEATEIDFCIIALRVVYFASLCLSKS